MAQTEFFASLLEKHELSVETDAETLSGSSVTAAFDEPPPARDLFCALSVERLEPLLAHHRFALESQCDISQTLVFARPSFAPDLFESLTLQSAGRRGHVLQARVGVWFGRHGIVAGHSRQLTQLAPQSRTGIMILRSPIEARATEILLSNIAPPAAETFARTHGPDLLARLSTVRTRVSVYLTRLRPLADTQRMVARLISAATPDQLEFARRLLETPGIQRISAPQPYLAAALALGIYGEEIECRPHPFTTTPLKGNPTLLRLQLLVHHILDATESRGCRF
jgi:hypothetical protein